MSTKTVIQEYLHNNFNWKGPVFFCLSFESRSNLSYWGKSYPIWYSLRISDSQEKMSTQLEHSIKCDSENVEKKSLKTF